jgi:hypothetical protein
MSGLLGLWAALFIAVVGWYTHALAASQAITRGPAHVR